MLVSLKSIQVDKRKNDHRAFPTTINDYYCLQEHI